MADPSLSNATAWDILKWLFGGVVAVLSWLFRGHDNRIAILEGSVNDLKQTRITFEEADKRRLDLKADIYTKMVEIQASGERGRSELREDVNHKIDALNETINNRFDDLRDMMKSNRRRNAEGS